MRQPLYNLKSPSKFKKHELSNIILLTSGKFISIFGTRIYNFAISYYILSVTGSALKFGISLAVTTIPRILVSPIAGAIVDKLERKKIVIAMDLGRWAALFVLYLLTINKTLPIPYIYITSLILSFMDIFFNLASSASVPNIVNKPNIIKMNSVQQTLSSTGSILAPFLGGIVISFISIKYFILINAFSFLFSGISQCFIDYNINNINIVKYKKVSIINDLREGVVYMKTQTLVILLTFYSMLGNFLFYFGFEIPFPYLLLKCLKLSSIQYGIINSFISIGSIGVSIIISLIASSSKSYKVFLRSSLMLALSFILLGFSYVLYTLKLPQNIIFGYMLFTALIFGSSVVLININTNTVQQEIIDNNYLGRVLGLQDTFSSIISPLAMLFSGKLLEVTAPYVLPIASGVSFIIFIFVIFSNKTLQKI